MTYGPPAGRASGPFRSRRYDTPVRRRAKADPERGPDLGMIGRILSRYKILEEVGQGGMAVVYRGLDTSLGREVAVKVLHPHLAGQPESRARLEREAQAVAKLRHENILEIFDYSGPDSPDSFIVTEFIHGPTLTAFLQKHPIPLPEVAAMIASELAHALEHAHGLGVIHRDVKPENVMIGAGGVLKLTDFGIAQIVDKERMTVTGQLLGSPAYMSPEHIEGGRIDFRTDVFAVGILTYQLATGQLPFRGKNPHEVLKKIADCKFVPPEQLNPLVSPALSRTICRALAKSPDARFPDIGRMRRELCDDLATVGVSDPRAELAGFFTEPESWERAFRPRLVSALASAGRKAQARGKTASALSMWCRALTLAPDNSEVRALIDAVGQRRRHLRMAGIVAATLLVGGSVFAAVRMIIPPLAGPDAGGPAGYYLPDPPEARSVPPLAPRPQAATPPRIQPPRRVTPTGVHPTVQARRDVRLNVFQKGAQILVDGIDYGRYDGQPIQVTPGPHRLTFKLDPCCTQRDYSLAADQTAMTQTIKLPWKSGTLDIRTSPEDTTISYTTDRQKTPNISAGGKSIKVPFPADHDGNEMRVKLEVSAEGHVTRERICTARAGETVKCPVELDRIR
ncbi:MAG: serine/threonine protein kinase [Myxococcales bacterium]|nr:serine/threonine protein kinase [Myxococcales bacterium]